MHVAHLYSEICDVLFKFLEKEKKLIKWDGFKAVFFSGKLGFFFKRAL